MRKSKNSSDSRLADCCKGSILDSKTELLLRLQSSIDSLDGKEAIIRECFTDLVSFPEDQRISAAAFINTWAELYKLDEDFLFIKNLHKLATRGLAHLELITKNVMFTPLLKRIQSKLNLLAPVLKNIEESNEKLDLPVEELEKLKVHLEEGIQLLPKCEKTPWWSGAKRYKYHNKLIEWGEYPQQHLEILKVQGIRDVKDIAVTVKIIEEANQGMSGAGGLFGGAGLGTLFSALYDVLKELITKNVMFKPLLKNIKFRLDSLEPLLKDIERSNKELDLSDKELRNLKLHLEEGIHLVQKCKKIRWWSVLLYKRYKYANKLIEWDASLQRLLDILKVQGIRDVKDSAVTVKNVEEAVSRIELNMVIPKQPDSEAWCAVPQLPPLVVGLDFPLKELKRKLLKDKNVSMVVLTAPGGCGKTTLATKFCQDKDIKDAFKDNIFFVTVSKKPKLENIVQDLYQRKGFQVPTFQNEVSTATWLQRFLKEEGQNPLLIVLDDVWPGSESLVEKFDQFKTENYKFLVTSRSEFRGYGSPYYLQSLDHDSALKLFHHSASLGDKSSHIPKDLPEKF
ncbi:hypothetical protein DVH24_026341 [Malus domestica]|uniref:RPW8 domain-containing protein n=1 Tax=Malus domestica TaxID=3750 RepID=A0A498KND6_MALDO|nr:hypothetical protein DVH24_026341 [Malus domestica]